MKKFIENLKADAEIFWIIATVVVLLMVIVIFMVISKKAINIGRIASVVPG